MARPRVRDASDEEARAAERLRERRRQADLDDATLLALQWAEAEQDEEYPAGPISYITIKTAN